MKEHDDRSGRFQIDPALWRGMTQRRMSRRDLFRYAGAGAGAVSLASILAACGVGGSAKGSSPPPTGSAKASELEKIYGDGTPAGQLNFANWELYIDRSTLKDFTQETGIEVTYKTAINDNNPFLARIIPSLQGGEYCGFDLIVITNGGPIERMIALGYLTPLDLDLVPNFAKNASDAVKDPIYDPGNRYSVAWQSGLTAIGYNSKAVKDPPKSFGDLLDPKYKDRVGMFSNNQDLPCPALVWQGYDIQTSTPDEWRKTAEILTKARDDGIIHAFYDQSYITALENGEIDITQAWSGDIFIAAAPTDIGGDGFPEMELSLPDEGPVLFTDNMCIPVFAEHPVDAITWMNFAYELEVAATNADFIWYVSPVPAAKEIVLNDLDDPAVANSPLVFPSEEQLAAAHKYKVFKDAAEEEEWNSIWEPVYAS